MSDDSSTDSTDFIDRINSAANDASGRAGAAGRTIGRGLALTLIVPARIVKVALLGFFGAILRKLPFIGASFWQGAIKYATRQYQKAAGADVVNFSAEPHGIEPRAANWQEADSDEPDSRPGWTEKGGDRTWGAGAEGRDVERFGKADVIISDRAAHETATPLQMRVAEALDLEQVDGLVSGAEVNLVQMWPADPKDLASGGQQGQAMADGGVQKQQRTIEVDASAAGLEDAVIDLESGFGDGRGMRISARKYKEQYQATTDPEEMQKQEHRGFLAGRSGHDDGKMFKLAVIALLVVLGVAVGPTIINALFGTGGGGGGSLIPIAAGYIPGL